MRGMSSRNKRSFRALKVDSKSKTNVHDSIVGEEPLQININGKPYTVTMRTPGDDTYLVRGLLFTENIYQKNDLPDVKLKAEQNIASTWIAPDLLRSGYYQSRSLLSVSSCGICGKRELGDIEVDGAPLQVSAHFDAKLIHEMFDFMALNQPTFIQTGGAHAASCFDLSGEMLAIQEDIGRHNAVDKVIGELLSKNLLSRVRFLLVSGRISYEIVSKCFKAGIPILAAVSSPSSMSIEYAEALGITLLAFCRNESLTCYANVNRLSNREKISFK